MKTISQVPTIHDVAEKAGVSAATVSRVLNGNPGVRQPAKQAVEAAIAALRFAPNSTARRLKGGQTQTIAAIVPFFTRPSFVERLRGVSKVLEETGYDLIVYNVESEKRRQYCLAEVPRPDRADGVIIISMSPSVADVLLLERFGLPVVLVDARHSQFISVSEDSQDGGRKATEYLLELGHRKIAFIGGPLQDVFNFTNTSTAYRLRGYRAALTQAGLPTREDFIVIDPRAIGEESRDSAREQTRALMTLPDPPTAIFTASDTQAMGVLQAAHEMGLSVPRDLSVIGYDDIEVARFLQITTIRQNLVESGRRGALQLLNALDSDNYLPTLEIIPNEVVERGTTAAPSQGAQTHV